MRQAQTDEFLEFAAAHGTQLYRTACLLSGGDVHLAEDLVQETLGRVYANWRRVAGAQNPAAYANTVLVRVFLSYRRRRSSGESPVAAVPDIMSATTQDDPELRMALLTALGRLSARDRAVVVLRYWEDRSVEETSAALRLSAGVVRTVSLRALVRLRAQLGGTLADHIRH